MRSSARIAAEWVTGLLLGYMVGSAFGAGMSAIIFPLGSTAASFALKDDRVSAGVQFVLDTRVDHRLSTTSVEGGTVAVAVSGDRSMAAVALSGVRPAISADESRQVGLLLLCDDDAVNLGTLGDRFFTGPRGEGWENSVSVALPESCTDIVITVLDQRGELISYSVMPVRNAPQPAGELALGARA